MKRSWWLLALLVASCGEEKRAPDETFGDGGRLQAFWDQVPGAPRRGGIWYDTGLASTCAFFPAVASTSADAVTRCLPTPATSVGSFTRFADAACTEPVVATENRWFWLRESSGCGVALTHVYEMGDAVDPASLFEVGAAGCVPAASTPVNVRPFRRLGREIPLDELVTAAPARMTAGGRLAPYRRDASDGSWALMPYAWDAVLGVDVSPEVGRDRWQPLSDLIVSNGTQAFSDAGCTTRVAVAFGCHQPGYVLVSTGSATLSAATCAGGVPSRRRAHRAGPTLDPASVYGYDGGACVSGGAGGGGPFVTVGDLVADHEMASLSATLVGSDRIRAKWLGDAETPFVTVAGYEDTLSHTPCGPAVARDGAWRCLPPILSASQYADPACQVRAVETAADCEAPRLASFRSSPGDDFRAFVIQPGALPATYVRDAAGACLLVAGSADRAYFAVGAEVPTSAFAEMAVGDPR